MQPKYILRIVEQIEKGIESKNIEEETKKFRTELTKEADAFLQDINQIRGITERLFPARFPLDTCFYQKLLIIRRCLGDTTITAKFVGQLWVETCSSRSKSETECLLTYFSDDEHSFFWLLLSSLPVFLSQIELSPDFAYKWFLSIGVRVERDLMGGDFFTAIANQAVSFPQTSSVILRKYLSEELTSLSLHLATIILGCVLSSPKIASATRRIVIDLRKQLSVSPRISDRLCYHRSFWVLFTRDAISKEQLDAHLSIMLKATAEEVDEAFGIVQKCLVNRLSDENSAVFFLDWLKEHSTSQISSQSKYHIVSALCTLSRNYEKVKGFLKLDNMNNILIAIQPISQNDKSTWKEFEYYIIDRLQQDKQSFMEFFKRFATNAPGVSELFEKGDWEYLLSEMEKEDLGILVAEMLFSFDEGQRNVGAALFQKMPNIVFPPVLLNGFTENQLNVMLLDFIKKFLLGSASSKFLLLLEPRFRSVGDQLKDLFKNEMLIQATNYPGACLEEWKKIENPSELLKEVIQAGDKYFENLKKLIDCPAISFYFPGFHQARERARKEFTRKTSEVVKEKSVFRQLAKNIIIIYGNQWSVMSMDNSLGNPTPFKRFEHSMEFPRLELIDPEGMVLRRIRATIESEKKTKDILSSEAKNG